MTREEWLNVAVERLNELIADETDLKPSKKIQISAGWPRNDRRGKVIGQCYAKKASNGYHNVFVAPTLGSAADVLPVVLHELIHAADDCEHHHTGAFRRAWKALGFKGKPTECTPGDVLKGKLAAISAELDAYPHKKLVPGLEEKKQSTRMIKVECPDCGCVARMSRKWIKEVGAPMCACRTTQMKEAA